MIISLGHASQHGSCGGRNVSFSEPKSGFPLSRSPSTLRHVGFTNVFQLPGRSPVKRELFTFFLGLRFEPQTKVVSSLWHFPCPYFKLASLRTGGARFFACCALVLCTRFFKIRTADVICYAFRWRSDFPPRRGGAIIKEHSFGTLF